MLGNLSICRLILRYNNFLFDFGMGLGPRNPFGLPRWVQLGWVGLTKLICYFYGVIVLCFWCIALFAGTTKLSDDWSVRCFNLWSFPGDDVDCLWCKILVNTVNDWFGVDFCVSLFELICTWLEGILSAWSFRVVKACSFFETRMAKSVWACLFMLSLIHDAIIA